MDDDRLAIEREEHALKQRSEMKAVTQAALASCELAVIRGLWNSGQYEEVGQREIALDVAYKG